MSWPAYFPGAIPGYRKDDIRAILCSRPGFRWFLWILMYFLILVWGDFGRREFICFQFQSSPPTKSVAGEKEL